MHQMTAEFNADPDRLKQEPAVKRPVPFTKPKKNLKTNAKERKYMKFAFSDWHKSPITYNFSRFSYFW